MFFFQGILCCSLAIFPNLECNTYFLTNPTNVDILTVLSMLMYLPFTKELNISASRNALANLTKKSFYFVPAFCGQELTYLNKMNRYVLTNVFSLPLCLSTVFVNFNKMEKH